MRSTVASKVARRECNSSFRSPRFLNRPSAPTSGTFELSVSVRRCLVAQSANTVPIQMAIEDGVGTVDRNRFGADVFRFTS